MPQLSQFLLGSNGLIVAIGTMLMGIALVIDVLLKCFGETRPRYFSPIISTIVGLLLIVASVSAYAVRFTTSPEIRVIGSPGTDPELRNVSGVIDGLGDPEKYKIVLYARTDHWYVQPFLSQTSTDITANGAWAGETHFGNAYGALVVDLDYYPEPVVDALPPLGGKVKAKVQW